MMKPYGLIVATAIAVCAPQTARAQDQPPDVKLSPMQLSIACAIPPATVVPGTATLRVIGAQDTIPRTTFAERDLLVIDAGTDKGVQLDQQYFVRRPVRPGLLTGLSRRAIQTAGWIRIVAVNETTAIASVTHTCTGRPSEKTRCTTPSAVPTWPAASGPVLQWVSRRIGSPFRCGSSAAP